MLVLGYFQNVLLQYASGQINLALRGALIRSLLAQELQYFERLDLENLPEDITAKIQSVTNCIGDRLGKLCFAVGAVLGSLLITLWISPKFSLGLLLAVPTLICVGTCTSMCLFQKMGKQI